MYEQRLELPVSTTAQDLFALEEELRAETAHGGEPDPNILSNLPPAIRDRIILQLEFMELQAGQIRTIFASVHPDPEERRKAKEKNRRAWEYLLESIAAYVHSFSEAAFVVAAAKIAVDDAIITLDHSIRRLQKFKHDPDVYSQIKDFKSRKARLEQFRNVTLSNHEQTLKSDPAPRESKLTAITQEVHEKLAEESLTHKIFSRLMKMAPGVIEKFRLRNTTKSLFKDVAKEVTPLRPLPLPEPDEPEPPEEPFAMEPPAVPGAAQKPKRKRLGARVFSGLAKSVSTVASVYQRVSVNHRDADTVFNRKAGRGVSARIAAAAITLPVAHQAFEAQAMAAMPEASPVRMVAPTSPPRMPAPDDLGYFAVTPQDLDPEDSGPEDDPDSGPQDDFGGDDDGDDGNNGGDHDDHGPGHPL